MLLKRVQGVPPPLFPLLPGTTLFLVVPTCIVGLPLMRDPLHRDNATYPRLHILGAPMSSWVAGRADILFERLFVTFGRRQCCRVGAL